MLCFEFNGKILDDKLSLDEIGLKDGDRINIKKSPFFYTSKESRLCIKLLEELEEGIVKGDAYDCYPAI